MTHIKKIALNTYSADSAIRAGDFRLLPENPSLPIIVSQPIKNFTQFTWVQRYKNGMPILQEVAINNNTVNMLEGTEFGLSLKTIDPSNINDVNSDTNLSYKWKKDGALLYQLNALNGGVGVNSFLVEAKDGIAELSGKYTCDITNRYGTVETESVTINILNPLKHPKLYKNLILNGDGEGGLDGWQGDPDIKTNTFINNTMVSLNCGSFRLAGLVTYEFLGYDMGVSDTTRISPSEFYFSITDHNTMFFPKFTKAWTTDPSFKNIDIKQKTAALNDWEWWTLAGIIPQIVLNEDYKKSNHATFFPGPKWMDDYNKNGKVTGLTDELQNYTPTYFTRDKLKFEKFGGKKSAVMIQNVDLADVADFVDGNVYGVQYTTSQFFAYVGAGITRYTITIQTTEGEKTFNYNIADTEDLFNHIFGNVITDAYLQPPPNRDVYNYESDLFRLGTRIKLLPNSEIKITPIVDDATTITLDFISDSGEILKTETVDGPDETDVWAIKEKVFFPLTLYGIFEFLKPNGNNPITVFGQKYTDTSALAPFFTPAGEDTTTGAIINPQAIPNPYTFDQWFNVDKNPNWDTVSAGDLFWFETGWNEGWNAAPGATNPYESAPPYVKNFLGIVIPSAKKIGWQRGYTDQPTHQTSIGGGKQGPIGGGINSPLSDLIRDVNAKFLLRKFPFKDLGGAYPGEPYGVSPALQGKSSYRAVQDFGAAAMFGVGKNVIVPYKTRSVRVSVEFKHKSEIIRDINPEGKGWKLQEIYSDDNGQSTGRSKRMVEYGTPRCAITKVKFLLAPNDLNVSDKYATFLIPPAESTALGLQKKKYTIPSAFNTADRFDFNYELTLPPSPPSPPLPTDIFASAKSEEEYNNSLGKTTATQVQETVEPDVMGTSDDIQAQEDSHYNDGDYNENTGKEF